MNLSQPTPRPVSLVGSSIPRSGHHFLVRILRRAYGKELYYCGFYKVAGCCKQIPCTRTAERTVVFQKSHDWDFSLPTELEGVTYIVQHRHPVPQALSDIELHLRDAVHKGRTNKVSTQADLQVWLARKAHYYKRFHDKWMAEKRDNAILVPYEELAEDPAGTVQRMLVRAGAATPTQDKIEEAIEVVSGHRGRKREYKPRVVQDSPHFDEPLFSAYESMLLDLCPGFGYAPMLKRANYRRTGLYRRFLLHSLKRGLGDRVRALFGKPARRF